MLFLGVRCGDVFSFKDYIDDVVNCFFLIQRLNKIKVLVIEKLCFIHILKLILRYIHEYTTLDILLDLNRVTCFMCITIVFIIFFRNRLHQNIFNLTIIYNFHLIDVLVNGYFHFDFLQTTNL